MIFKNDPQAIKENSVSERRETSSSIPKMGEPITKVSSLKTKKKTATKSASKKKTGPKTKRGESKTPLSMGDLYEKENTFISTVVKPNVGTSEKDPMVADDETTIKIAADVAYAQVEKGNPNKT